MDIEITRNGSQPSTKGPADWFTGTVRIDPLFAAKESVRAASALVTFEPGARTAWHTHPLGQTLIVMTGLGWVQREGGPVQEIRPGDVVWFPPGLKHWHGATPTTRCRTSLSRRISTGRSSTGWSRSATSIIAANNPPPCHT